MKLLAGLAVVLTCAVVVQSASLRLQVRSEEGRRMFYDSAHGLAAQKGSYADVMDHYEKMIATVKGELDRLEGSPDGERYERVLNSNQVTHWSTICKEGADMLNKIKGVAEVLAGASDTSPMHSVLDRLEQISEEKDAVCQRLLEEIDYATRLARDYFVSYSAGENLGQRLESRRMMTAKDAVAKREAPDYIIVPGCVNPKESVIRAQYALDYWLMLPPEHRERCHFVLSGMGFWQTEGAFEDHTTTTLQHMAFMRKHTKVQEELSDDDKSGLDLSSIEAPTEAGFMKEVILKTLEERGMTEVEIPDSLFIMDEEARDTVGNAVFSLLEIMKHHVRTSKDPAEGLRSIPEFLRSTKEVLLVSSTYHIIRAHDFYARVFPLQWSLGMNAVTVTDQWARENDNAALVCSIKHRHTMDLGALNCAQSISLSIQQNFLVDDKMEAKYLWMDHVPLPEMLMHLTKNHPLYNGYHQAAANHAEFMQLINPSGKDEPQDNPLRRLAQGKAMFPEPITMAKDKVGNDLLDFYLGEDMYGPVIAQHWATTFNRPDFEPVYPGVLVPPDADADEMSPQVRGGRKGDGGW